MNTILIYALTMSSIIYVFNVMVWDENPEPWSCWVSTETKPDPIAVLVPTPVSFKKEFLKWNFTVKDYLFYPSICLTYLMISITMVNDWHMPSNLCQCFKIPINNESPEHTFLGTFPLCNEWQVISYSLLISAIQTDNGGILKAGRFTWWKTPILYDMVEFVNKP